MLRPSRRLSDVRYRPGSERERIYLLEQERRSGSVRDLFELDYVEGFRVITRRDYVRASLRRERRGLALLRSFLRHRYLPSVACFPR